MRYIIFILIFFYPINIFASSKELIKNKLNETDNISFKFIQKIGKVTEKGECIIFRGNIKKIKELAFAQSN